MIRDIETKHYFCPPPTMGRKSFAIFRKKNRVMHPLSISYGQQSFLIELKPNPAHFKQFEKKTS